MALRLSSSRSAHIEPKRISAPDKKPESKPTRSPSKPDTKTEARTTPTATAHSAAHARRQTANDTSIRQVRHRAEQKLTGAETTARDKPNPSRRRFTIGGDKATQNRTRPRGADSVNAPFVGGRKTEVGSNYEVQRGDSLGHIARDHGISLSQLTDANPQIRDPDLIYPGQHINLPSEVSQSSRLAARKDASGPGTAINDTAEDALKPLDAKGHQTPGPGSLPTFQVQPETGSLPTFQVQPETGSLPTFQVHPETSRLHADDTI